MSIKRRDFIKGSAVGAVGVTATINSRPASAQIMGANDHIRLGVIGRDRQGRTT